MNRDHLLGFPPAALVSANCPDDYDDTAIFDYERYPLGFPRDYYIRQRERLDAIYGRKQPLRDFENIPQPNPDGSYTPKHPGRLFAKKVADTAKVEGAMNDMWEQMKKELEKQLVEHAMKHGSCPPDVGLGAVSVFAGAVNPMYADARKAIPLSELVPPGVMVGGTEPAKWLVQGNQFFVNGREVDRKEFERTHGQTKQAEPAQQQKPVPAGALARALHRMNTDPDYRAQMAQRITAVNAKLAQERPSKGDGGIALPELTAGELARFTPCSIPITINTGGFDTGFDFPPNA
jgi:hypothetical protein